jgi:hypothetical protein
LLQHEGDRDREPKPISIVSPGVPSLSLSRSCEVIGPSCLVKSLRCKHLYKATKASKARGLKGLFFFLKEGLFVPGYTVLSAAHSE